jgi:uncharacterized protein with PCYCGC motif
MKPLTTRFVVSVVLALVLTAAVAGIVWLASRRGKPSGSEPGVTSTDFSARFAGFEPALEPNGDLDKVVWPDFVLAAGPEVKRLYEFQIENGELMRYMPCFCGCGQNAGHRSNRDCYVRRVRPDGSVVLDPMAPT